MRVAFYAPLKPPSHPVPSGDRRIARLLLKALRRGGHDVRVVSTFRSYEGDGDRAKQDEIERRGAREAERLLRTKLKRWRPEAWFTYHLYQKAPDWLGPPIAEKLGIPYLVAEAAYAPRRSKGRWDRGLAAVKDALRRADTVFMLNPNDEECVAPLLRKRSGAEHTLHALLDFPELAPWKRRARTRPAAAEPMLPFLETKPFFVARWQRRRRRAALAAELGISEAMPWLLAVGMMRSRDKLRSYQVLAEALAGLEAECWHLLVAGDGPARDQVHQAFQRLAGRVHWLGVLPEARLRAVTAACDLFVWPAINEAVGMAALEAQALGLPAVAGDVGAMATILRHGETGTLVPEGDATALREAVRAFLGAPAARRAEMSNAAAVKAQLFNDIGPAAEQLDRVLRAAVRRAQKRRR